MEIWLVIILSVVVVSAVALLLYLDLMGNSGLRVAKKRHTRGEHVNDQTAVICHTIQEIADSGKAYTVFVEYLLTNYKLFLRYVKTTFPSIRRAYAEKDTDKLHEITKKIKEMRVELKDQKQSQEECLKSMDPVAYIESLTWINLANSCMFEVNDGLKNLVDACIEYIHDFIEPYPKIYSEQLDQLADDISSICNTIYDLVGTAETEEMRQLRKNASLILSESHANSQRLYEVLHDGRSDMPEEKRIALKYALNAFQECHCTIFDLRRLILAIICLTLSINND